MNNLYTQSQLLAVVACFLSGSLHAQDYGKPVSRIERSILETTPIAVAEVNIRTVATEKEVAAAETPDFGPAISSEELLQSLTSKQQRFLQGIALPWQDGQLTITTPSIVTKIHVKEGQWVEAGDPIVSFDDRVALATVEVARQSVVGTSAMKQAELQMQAAQSLLIRTQTAYRAGASSDFEIDAKRNEYNQALASYQLQVESQKKAEAELALAEAELELKTIRAPFSGTVVHIPAKVGNALQAGDKAARIVSMTQLRVDMHLPTILFGRVSQGQSL
ncbi:MAG: HlyD family efflux transporter periplasmic adaptor subunit, partial [Planctomycetota bacterium]